MPKPKRLLNAAAEATTVPPDELPNGHTIAKIVSASGKNLFCVALPAECTLLVELNPKFRNCIWMKKGSYVVVDTTSLADRDNKLSGEIVNVVRDEKQWRKMPWWPVEFSKRAIPDDESDEESNVGKMPPSDSEDESLE